MLFIFIVFFSLLISGYLYCSNVLIEPNNILAQLDEEAARFNFGNASYDDLQLNSTFAIKKEKYIDFFSAFLRQFSWREIDLKNDIKSDILFDDCFKAWQESFRKNQSALSALRNLAKENQLPFDINTPWVVRHLLSEVGYSGVIDDWNDYNVFVNINETPDISKAQENFLTKYSSFKSRIDFCFSLLLFFTYSGDEKINDESSVKKLLSSHEFFNCLMIIENRIISVADVIKRFSNDPEFVFLDNNKPIFNFSKGSKDVVTKLSSIKIIGHVAGILGFAEWPKEYVEAFFDGLKAAGGIRNVNVNTITFSLPFDGIKLSLVELRLLANQEYLGARIERNTVYTKIFGRFKTVSGFKVYLQLVDHWFDKAPKIKGLGSNTLTEELFFHFLSRDNDIKDAFISAVRYDIGNNKDYHIELLEKLVDQNDQYEKNRQKTSELINKTSLTEEEERIVQQMGIMLNVMGEEKKEKTSFQPSKKRKNRGGKKSKGKGSKGRGSKADIEARMANLALQASGPANDRRKSNHSCRSQNEPMTPEQLASYYPDLSVQSDVLFVAKPVNLLSDIQIYRKAIKGTLRFRKSEQHNIDILPPAADEQKQETPAFDASSIQRSVMELNPQTLGYSIVLDKLLETQALLNERLKYNATISNLLQKMALDNFIAKRNYFRALEGFITLREDCEKFLTTSTPKNEEERIAILKKKGLVEGLWLKIVFLQKIPLNTADARRALAQEFFDANIRAEEIITLVNQSTDNLYVDDISRMSEGEKEFNQNLSLKAQEEITRETYIIEQKISDLQDAIIVIYHHLPEVLERVLGSASI